MDKSENSSIKQSTIKRLVNKSKEAFIVGLELYNRPTIRYRVEGCAFMLCNAWELMLKAYFIQKYGEDFIYYKDNPNRTLSLEDCVRKIYTNEHSPIRQNLDRIIDLRNTGTHFIVEEYEGIYAPILKANVSNYDKQLKKLMGIEISDELPINYSALTVRRSDFRFEESRVRYSPNVLDRLLRTVDDVAVDSNLINSEAYASKEILELRETKKKDADITFRIANSDESAIPTKRITRVIDPSVRYPLRNKALVAKINEKLDREHIAIYYAGKKKSKFSTSDFQLFDKYYGIKGNPLYSYNTSLNSENPYYAYSQQTIEFIFNILRKDPEGTLDSLKKKTSRKDKKRANDGRPQEHGNSKS